MTAKEYLSQAKRLRIKIEQKKKLLQELQIKATGGGSLDLKPDKVQTSLSGSRLEESVIEYVDLIREIEDDIRRYYTKRNEIIDTIHSLGDSRYIMVLHAKWIDEESLERIAADMNFSFGYIRNLYHFAMKRIEKSINNT